MTKFESTYKFLLENYIKKGTYAYTVGAEKTLTTDIVGKDLGAETNEKNICDAVCASKFDTALGKYPSNLTVKKYGQFLLTCGIEKIKKLVAAVNKELQDDCKIEVEKDSCAEELVEQLYNKIGNNPICWQKYNDIVNFTEEL